MTSENRRAQMRAQQEAVAKQKRMNRIVAMAAGVVGVVLLGVFGVVIALNWGAQNSSLPPHATSAKDGIVVNPGKAVAGAKVVTLYFDYQCPICKVFEDSQGPTLLDMANKGEIVLQYNTMTFLDSNLLNDSSTKAGVAATCADFAGKYSDFHNAIFAAQPQREGAGYQTALLRETIPQQVGIAGSALTSFQQCFDAKATLSFVKGTQDAAFKAGVNGTPTLRVNGKSVQLGAVAGWQDPDLVRRLIAAASA